MNLRSYHVAFLLLFEACSQHVPAEKHKDQSQTRSFDITSVPFEKTKTVSRGQVAENDKKVWLDTKIAPARHAQSEKSSAIPASLQIAMDRFVVSLRSRDTKSFLGAFSLDKVWYDVNTLEGNQAKVSVTYKKLKRDLDSKTGFYTTIFDAEGDDCLRDYTMSPYDSPWKMTGPNTFSPPNADEKSVWVRWRTEKGRWVVDAIAQPSA
jgi:hypothetical protein